MAIASASLADVSDLVCECYFDRVKCIVGIFQAFCHANAGTNDRSLNSCEQPGNTLASTTIQFSNDGLRRLEEILHRGTLPQKFRHHADTEVAASLFA